jgi:hypothetical protein
MKKLIIGETDCFMKKIISLGMVFCLVFLFAGCSGGTSDSKKVLEEYVKSIQDSDYESAYSMLTGFDQGNISKELFTEWQSTAAKLSKLESFEIDKTVDKFKNYEYMGAKYKKAYGFRVLCKRKTLVPDAKTEGYDSEDYRIMVADDKGELKVALLLTKLEDTVKNYKRQLEK